MDVRVVEREGRQVKVFSREAEYSGFGNRTLLPVCTSKHSIYLFFVIVILMKFFFSNAGIWKKDFFHFAFSFLEIIVK